MIHLGVLPSPTCPQFWDMLPVWREVIQQKRSWYDNLKKGNVHSEVWQSEAWNNIIMDVDRLYPGNDFFREEEVQSTVKNILLVWACANPGISYHQGMHELAAIFVLVLREDHASSLEEADSQQVDFHDDIMFEEHDAFSLFDALMGYMKDCFNHNPLPEEEWKQMLSWDTFDKDHQPMDIQEKKSFCVVLGHRIQNVLLQRLDPELHQHLSSLNIHPFHYVFTWLRLLFLRQFDIDRSIQLWDALFAEQQVSGFLDLTQSLCVAMLVSIRKHLLGSSFEPCIRALNDYPTSANPVHLVQLARSLSQEKGLSGAVSLDSIAQIFPFVGGGSQNPPFQGQSADGVSSTLTTDRTEGVVAKSEYQNGLLEGETRATTLRGEAFIAPQLCDVMDTIFSPSRWTPPVVITWVLGLLHLAALVFQLPVWMFVVSTIFWRLAYDVGIGYILRHQSRSFWFQNRFNDLIRQAKYATMFESWFSRTRGCEHKLKDYPLEFNAWMAYRYIVDIVLVIDFWSYFCLVMRSLQWFPLSDLTWTSVAQILGSFIFGMCSLWAKMDAHRILGDFGWYWGDFFFKVDKEMVFDGVFQMFPHPMYTAGYGFMYAAPIFAMNFMIYYVTLFSHGCQILFLIFVEEPHIDKIYGNPDMAEDPNRVYILFNSKTGYFRSVKECIFLFNLSLSRVADISLVLLVTYNIILCILSVQRWFFVSNVIFWRLFQTLGLGFLLYYQGRDRSWTNRFLQEGKTNQDAFQCWKMLYNMAYTMNVISFAVCCWVFAEIPDDWWTHAFLCRFLTGVLLLGIGFWGNMSSLETLGLFGWFYGDFFIKEVDLKLKYGGIYRYMNHPNGVYGYAGFYGMALISHSWNIFFLAIFSHVCHLLFIYYVERPHMKRTYTSEKLRKFGGITTNLRRELLSKPALRSVHDFWKTKRILLEEKLQLDVVMSKWKKFKRAAVAKANKSKFSRIASKAVDSLKDVVFTAPRYKRNKLLPRPSSFSDLDYAAQQRQLQSSSSCEEVASAESSSPDESWRITPPLGVASSSADNVTEST